MGSLLTSGWRIMDVTRHDFLGFFISFISFFAFYHFEHIYLICEEIGHIILLGKNIQLFSLTQTR
jgi:hypothetical protein